MWLNIVEGVAGVVMLVVAVKVNMFGAKHRPDMVIYGEKLVKVMCEHCREVSTWGHSCVQMASIILRQLVEMR